MDMDIRPLKTEADYDWALAEIAPCFDEPPPADKSRMHTKSSPQADALRM
jgi:antitoxin component HigA of HigAB toxin-antitoxin module